MPYRNSGRDDDNLEVYVKVPVPKSSSSRTIAAAMIGAVAVILAALIPVALASNHSSTQTSAAIPTPTLEQSATALIEQYFSDLNNKDYRVHIISGKMHLINQAFLTLKKRMLQPLVIT